MYVMWGHNLMMHVVGGVNGKGNKRVKE